MILFDPFFILKILPRKFTFGKRDRSKDRLHPVIVPGRYRIKLVIMTLGATQFIGKKSYPHRIDHIIQILLPSHCLDTHGSMFPRTHPQKPSGNEMIWILGFDFIAGNLLTHELIIRLVIIK